MAAAAEKVVAAGNSGILHSLHSTCWHPEEEEEGRQQQQQLDTHSSRNQLYTHNIPHSIGSDLAEAVKYKKMEENPAVRFHANAAYKLNVSVQSA